jgi:hypothetical protein
LIHTILGNRTRKSLRYIKMAGLSNGDGSATHANGKPPKKQMLLNAFDMSSKNLDKRT